ncbi:MAG: GerW family sporulation protein [Lachnospiraceae bacterium]|nr:GerW family sporulation protein [Lachnospiraceae bacterium]MBQ7260194.1 GerW family sporulation protein [Lachnospiraceae bacterium]
MAEKGFNNVVESLMSGMNGFLTSKTVMGEPVKVGDTIIIPFVEVSFGMGAGDFKGDKKDNGAGGLSGRMSPSAVLIIANGTTRLVNIKNQDGLTKILEMVPDLVNNLAARKNKTVDDDEAVNEAFPEEDKEQEE